MADFANNEQYNYTYDTNGNIESLIHYEMDSAFTHPISTLQNYSYTYGKTTWGDLLTKWGGQTITYDQIGNPLNYRDGITMTWKNGRELASFENDDVRVTYTYDPDGLRTRKNYEGLVTTDYVYEGGLLKQMKYGSYIFTFSYDAYGSPIGFELREEDSTSSTYYYYGVNSRGDVLALYNSAGTQIASYSYDPYGKPISINKLVSGHTTAIEVQPLRYRSYVYDFETGLYYLQSRYYDPVTCRFINADGYVSTGQGITGNNMFAYCNNNPIVYADYSGYVVFGVTFNANAFVCFGVSFSVAFVWDDKGNTDWQISYSIPGVNDTATVGALATVGVSMGVQITNDKTVYDSYGYSSTIGIGGKLDILGDAPISDPNAELSGVHIPVLGWSPDGVLDMVSISNSYTSNFSEFMKDPFKKKSTPKIRLVDKYNYPINSYEHKMTLKEDLYGG